MVEDIERYVRPVSLRSLDPRRTDMRPEASSGVPTLGRPLPRVGPGFSRPDLVLNKSKEVARGRPRDLEKCFKCRGVGYLSRQCPTYNEHAFFIEDTMDEKPKGKQPINDDASDTDEIVAPVQALSDDDVEGEDSGLAVMRTSYPT